MINEGYRVSNDNEDKELQFSLHWLKQTRYQLLLILFTTLLAYSNSFTIPFYLDDHYSIVENPVVHSFDNLLEQRNYQIMRLVGYTTLTANYTIHQTHVFGYHLVNFLIHVLTALAVFLLAKALLKAVEKKHQSSLSTSVITYLPLLSALLFALHPLQTQAVSYIIQRHASLAALFYISAIAFYLLARNKHNLRWFFAAAIAATLAFLSKENTVTLPLLIFLAELLFFQKLNQKNILKWLTAGLAASIALMLIFHYGFGITFERIDQLTHTQDVKHISRLDYLATQMLVIWHYIKLFFFPFGLHLDYDIQLQNSFLSASVLMATLAHLVVISSAVLMYKRLPLITFAIGFYYIAHSIESGIIPINDFAFEHRTYLPNLGLAILSAYVLCYLLELRAKSDSEHIMWILIAAILLSLSALTFARNQQWNNPVSFYENETKLSPNKERVWAELGKVYLKEKQFKEALETLGKALNLGKKGNSIEALPTTFLNTYIALLYTNQFDKAKYFETIMPVDKFTTYDHSTYLYMMANRQVKTRDFQSALVNYKKAIELNPRNFEAKANYAALLIETGKKQQGLLLLNQIIMQNKQHKLANLYLKKYQ